MINAQLEATTILQPNVYQHENNIHKLHTRIAELERSLEEQLFLVEINKVWINESDINTSIKKALQLAMNITGSEAGCLYIFEQGISKLKTIEVNGNIPSQLVEELRNINRLFGTDKTKDITVISQFDKKLNYFLRYDSKLISLAIVPLNIGENMIGYTVVMHRKERGHHQHTSVYSEQDILNLRIFSHNTALILENNVLKIEQGKKEFYFKIIDTLVSAIDAKDLYTQNHSKRVSRLTKEFSKFLGLDSHTVEVFQHGALLHDIGKIGISDVILNKPSTLSEHEFEIIKSHPMKGAKIVAPLEPEKDILHIVKHHHERFDGRGYPDGLKGKEIPLSARIVTIVDAWDAMTDNRAYRPRLTFDRAVEELEKGKSTQFDPSLVDQYIQFVSRCDE
ncbi:hypothetical protein BHU72_06395 [Desulfuribacillus stibiiarsenatis]|uniref:Uncharacterized protein n=1 Tax=Desulfuribacillus stibiiarsenatis TaxID=1390249 RepID=A0A1E5L542_9FIRM|nr:HD domain-containing phosphohydrolase [Desulfuribacillus stibiiarsenatis]OEH85230.1 hypothetical protein BHU72_06395 [Desulfuribacillus stibiiarsenatis]